MLASDVKKIKSESKSLVKKYDGLIKTIWVYGSAARLEETPHDIDMLMIIDDTRGDISEKIVSSLRGEMDSFEEKMKKEKLNIHWQSPKPLSLWWDMLRGGNPLAFTSMRDAVIIYDPAGYLEPLQILLKKGRLAGTREQAEELIGKAPLKLELARKVFLEEITSDLMSALTECSHAVLMFAGMAPPAQKNVRTALRESFVSRGLLEEKYVEDYEDFFDLAKKIEHGELTKISGHDLDRHLEKASSFIERMEKLFTNLEAMKRRSIVETAYRVALAACANALRQIGQTPPKQIDSLIETFKKHFVDTGLVSREYLNVLLKLKETKSAVEKGKLAEIPEKDIYESEVYAHNLAHVLQRVKRK